MDLSLSAPSQESESRARSSSCERQLELEKTLMDSQLLSTSKSYFVVLLIFDEVGLKRSR